MPAVKYKPPTKEEKEILIRNGVDPEGVAVFFRDEDCIMLLRYKTRDTITIKQGDKKWTE